MHSVRMESNVTGMWVGFFSAAGIPSDVSATYALTFAENRIQHDMLLDLNKEYLRDMGITRMGDVIAILRHAKQVHESAARDRVLSTAAPPGARVPVAAVAGRLTVQQAKPSSPASRILEHYTRRADAPAAAKRKLGDSGGDDCKKTRMIRFGAAAPPPAPVTEGLTSKTVFARLGGSEAVAPAALAAPAAPAAPGRPVFSRLGARSAPAPAPAAPAPAPAAPCPRGDALKYEGILKAPLMKKVVTVTASRDSRRIAVGSMRADEAPLSVKAKLAKPKSVKFSSEVQYKEIANAVFNKPERRLSMPEAPAGVKARLGGGGGGGGGVTAAKQVNNLTITKNVFNRLGV